MSSDVLRSHIRNGEWELARAGAEAALRTAPEEERGVLYALLSRSLRRLGRARDALAAAEEGAKRSDHWEVTLALGEAMVAVGEPVAAKALLQEAMHVAHDASTLPDAPGGRPAEIPSTPDAFHASADDESPWVAAEVGLGTALAEAYRASGDPQTGLQIATRSVSLAEHAAGTGSLEVAEALHALGVCLHAADRDDEARTVLSRALAIRRTENPEHTDVAATLDALGKVARARKRPFDAVKLHQEALALWIRRLGPHAGPVGACRHALAQAIHRTGDFLAAREQMRQALEITRHSLGEDHVDTHIARFELGRFEMDCGEPEKGMAAMEAARTAVRARLGTDHPVVRAMDRFL